jgi:hypothetical protein
MRTPKVRAAIPVFSLLVSLAAAPSWGATCGDLNGDGRVGPTDALLLLEKSAGMGVDLVCPASASTEELEARVAALEALLAGFTVEGDTLVLSGMNLQIVNGTGATDGGSEDACRRDKDCADGFCSQDHVCAVTNGLGNLIVGYNEADDDDLKSGSHNVIVGPFHSYSGYGALVAGHDNRVERESASVVGGQQNEATEAYASVSGGRGNQASGVSASVAGGSENSSEDDNAAILGGSENVASGDAAAICGGSFNRARGERSSISGGLTNVTAGFGSSVAGGNANVTIGRSSTVVGGALNRATEKEAVVVGGRGNQANGQAAVVLGREGLFTNSELDLLPHY